VQTGLLVADRYRVVRPLGSGGLATAFLVRDEALDIEVALKLLHPGVDPRPLMHELETLVGLVHPSLVRVHDFGVATVAGAPRPFLTMDAVLGATLDEHARGRTFADLLPCLVDVCSALLALHAAGSCHGDVKPDNIVIDARGRATLLDLSCARRVGEPGGQEIAGTPGYLAPEVLLGAEASPLQDVFGLGCTLRVIAPALAEPLPPEMAALLGRLTHEDPTRRPASMAEVLEHLGARPGSDAALLRQPRRLIGRGAELAAMLALVSALEVGEPAARALLVEGQAGVGTSRLLRELKWQAQPKVRLVEAFAHAPRPMLALFARAAGADLPGEPALAAVATADKLRARGEPTLLLVDDADALDDPDREALRALLRLVGPAEPWGVIAAHRGVMPLAAGAAATSIRLEPLGESDVAAWIADVGAAGSTREIYLATGGFPADIAARLAGDERFVDDGSVVDTRLAASLGPELGRALALLVAMGPLATERDLASARVSPEQLGALQRLGLAARRVGGWALARPAMRERLSGLVDVRAAHEALADARLESLRQTEDPARGHHAASAVRHLALASRTDEALALVRASRDEIERAPGLWRSALQPLGQGFAPALALELAEALLAAGDAPRAREIAAQAALAATTREERLRAAQLSAQASLDADDAQGVLAATARAAAFEPSDKQRAVLADLEARARIRLGDHAAARALAEPALAGARDPGVLASLHEDVGVAASYTGDHAVARVHLAMAAGLQRDLIAPKRLVRALSYQAIDAYRSGDLEAALAGYRQALAVAEEHGLGAQIARASLNLGTASHARGRLGDAHAAYERGLRLATALGQVDLAVVLEFNLAKLYADVGAFERARVRAESARGLAEERAMDFFVAAAASVVGDCLVAARDFAGATACFQEARAKFEALGAHREALEEEIELARTELASGAADAAARRVARASKDETLQGAPDLDSRAATLSARIALHAGEGARAVADAQHALRKAREARQPDLLAEAHAVLADAAAALGQSEDSARAEESARSLWASLVESLPEALRSGFLRHPRRRDLGQKEIAKRALARDGRAEKLERLVALFRKLNSSLETSDVLAMTLDAAIELTNAERGFLLSAPAQGEMRVAVARNIDREKIGKSHLKFSRGIAERAVETGEPVVTVDAQADERFRENASVHAMKLRSVLAVPIRSPDGVLGALYVDNRFGRGRFEPEDVDILLSFADQAALALRNAELLATLREQTKELEAERARIAQVARGQAEEIDRLAEAVKVRQEALESRYDYGAIVGRSPALKAVLRTLDRVVDSPLTVLVTGESGTGKELVARAVHFASARKAGPFVGINCAALPSTLLESELFGHVRGAFTGADRDRTGLMVAARGGTLFLDELGELPIEMQAKLLRVLQEREVRPLGSTEAVPVDFRLVCATNRDLRAEVARGRFREDLYFRVGVVELPLPPLRSRLEDVPTLAAHFLRRASEQLGRPQARLSPAAMRALLAHSFPGNVRELENVLTRAAVLCERGEITPEDLGLSRSAGAARRRVAPPDERAAYVAALEGAGWNVVRAARELSVPRATFYRKLARFGLEGPRTQKRDKKS
jgi:transcriptional regulator with GAF, ATPase, and Fis domain/tetratricopeptide (TPR) repeat protein